MVMVTQLAPMRHSYESLLAAPDHQQRIKRIARKQTRGTTIDWEDAAQAAQIKILQALRQGKFHQGEPEAFYRWATTVARFEIIDLVRKEQHRRHTSLDAALPGTDLARLDTIADEFNAADNLERTDLVLRAIAAITELDQRHPDRGYLILWQGQVAGKKQTQLAADLGVTQGEVSKRWRELVGQVAAALGLVASTAVKRQQAQIQPPPAARPRSTAQW
jgi:RNA polymerase sigma factor (sigma-70 family)